MYWLASMSTKDLLLATAGMTAVVLPLAFGLQTPIISAWYKLVATPVSSFEVASVKPVKPGGQKHDVPDKSRRQINCK
jgi:hypothetical protein